MLNTDNARTSPKYSNLSHQAQQELRSSVADTNDADDNGTPYGSFDLEQSSSRRSSKRSRASSSNKMGLAY
jgi:hypothetical protein